MDYDYKADEEWVDDEEDSGDDLLMCPSCRSRVHEDTQQCPHCGDWIIPVYPSQHSRRVIWVVAAILVAAGLLLITIL